MLIDRDKIKHYSDLEIGDVRPEAKLLSLDVSEMNFLYEKTQNVAIMNEKTISKLFKM